MTTKEENLRHAAEMLLYNATQLHTIVGTFPDAGDQFEWWVHHYKKIYKLADEALKFAARTTCAAEDIDRYFSAQAMPEEENWDAACPGLPE